MEIRRREKKKDLVEISKTNRRRRGGGGEKKKQREQRGQRYEILSIFYFSTYPCVRHFFFPFFFSLGYIFFFDFWSGVNGLIVEKGTKFYMNSMLKFISFHIFNSIV